MSLDIISFRTYIYGILRIYHFNCWIIWLGCTDIAESQLRNRMRQALRLRKEKKSKKILKNIRLLLDNIILSMILYGCKRKGGILPIKKGINKEKIKWKKRKLIILVCSEL